MDQWINGPMVQWTMDQWTNGTLEHWNIETLEHLNIGTFEHLTFNQHLVTSIALILGRGDFEKNLKKFRPFGIWQR